MQVTICPIYSHFFSHKEKEMPTENRRKKMLYFLLATLKKTSLNRNQKKSNKHHALI